ncbi:hypothetical protein C1I98_21510 [Spongiactinospora gelatinilytica]|uniref:EF-hand domain-containing protein n=1 Tax=Spongiactinospora gelatinilytica TaxID=2666298 RepID=A0A2W2GFH8_9ACTN|nr:hypothetical protein C1I98_21510 [Spongiactinospora gelatinilytica]
MGVPEPIDGKRFAAAPGPVVDAVFGLIDLDGDGRVPRAAYAEYIMALTSFGISAAGRSGRSIASTAATG